ncbi:MAG TPA: hypothetical protein PLQ20_01535 [Candidatus Paceibacterota bacterium]|nr:hypothetical protein [Candidatus Paceibacterota bacterium]
MKTLMVWLTIVGMLIAVLLTGLIGLLYLASAASSKIILWWMIAVPILSLIYILVGYKGIMQSNKKILMLTSTFTFLILIFWLILKY